MRNIFLFILFTACFEVCAQKEISVDFGRAYYRYKFKDYGSGLKNANSANYDFIGFITYRNQFWKRFYWETGVGFTQFQQYFSTEKYSSAFSSSFTSILFPLRLGYRSVAENKFRYAIGGGVIVGILPERYTGEWESIYVYPIVDSVSRGVIYRNITTVFPLIDFSGELSYQFNRKLSFALLASYDLGLTKITEYEIHYNNGSGSNDQQARQWGNGKMFSIRAGVQMRLNEKKKK